ncbi:hypothetical protein Taro_021227 [Colocasia esculenta]|uniref:Uncharacterized protein n=1 Tax=Colocasia esculenta TaxID=4460 RepID=A0A843V1V3_COLES|nr:hypothetical protein [Colocasia esculenta]
MIFRVGQTPLESADSTDPTRPESGSAGSDSPSRPDSAIHVRYMTPKKASSEDTGWHMDCGIEISHSRSDSTKNGPIQISSRPIQ